MKPKSLQFCLFFYFFTFGMHAYGQIARQGNLLIEITNSKGILTQWNIYKGDSDKVRIEKNTPQKAKSELILIIGQKESRSVFQIFHKIKVIIASLVPDSIREKRWEDEINSQLSVIKLPDERMDSLLCKHFKVLSSTGNTYEMWTYTGLFGKVFYKSVFVSEPGQVQPYLSRFEDQGVGGDPIKIIEKDKSGKTLSIFEFKAFQSGKQPDSLFLLPEGYKKIKINKY